MENYKAVRSGLDISRSMADYWEQTAPNTTNEQRAKRIRAVNDILQGRSPKTVEAWEAGRNRPEGPVRRLFALLQRDPQLPDLLKPN